MQWWSTDLISKIQGFFKLNVVGVCMHGFTHARAYMWRSKANLLKSVLSFHQVGAGNRTQVVIFGDKCLNFIMLRVLDS